MDKSQKILSDVVVWSKYAKYIPELKRRETFDELVDRNVSMHVRKYPQLKKEIQTVYNEFVRTKKVLPSMRSMQFAGLPIELSNTRIFNCSYVPMDHPFAFSEMMFLLLSGVGVGYSVRKKHIDNLPTIIGPSNKSRRFLVGDSIEGWADAIKVLIKAYTKGKSDPLFDFRDIRPKGARLITSGGKAPGPDPLRICLDQVRSILNDSVGRRMTSIEVHDVCCFIADAVLAGGIRRSAMIVGFDADDEDMIGAKSGSWWEQDPQRGRANNSVILDRATTTKEKFMSLWDRVKASGAGEPGFYWTSSEHGFSNPCVETFLEPHQFCNLSEVSAVGVNTQEEFEARAKAGAFIGTLQAGYTDFHYLRPIWKETTERDALIGVGLTGIANAEFLKLDEGKAARAAVEENKRVAAIIGVNPAARVCVVKPAGSTSCVLGTSSGIHAWHDEYYIRRIRVGKTESLYHYLKEVCPELLEDCVFKPHIEAVLSIPQAAPEGSPLRSESVMHLLERVKRFNKNWITGGHVSGDNLSNVSCTISIKDKSWEKVGNWMWENRDHYTGISVLPYDGGSYTQAPFTSCTKEEHDRLMQYCKEIDMSRVIEHDDNTTLAGEQACAGGACEIK